MTGPRETVRVGRLQLEALRRATTETEWAVIRSLRQLGFATGDQLRRLHVPVGPHTEQGSARVARRVLARLAQRRVLVRLERRIGGVRAGSRGFTYALGPLGARLLESRRSRVREPSLTFLDHRLAVAEVVVRLVEATRISNLELALVETEPACWRRFLGRHGAPEVLKPDLRVTLGLESVEVHWFVEVDLGSAHLPRLVARCEQYERYWRSGREQEHHEVFPRVAWLVRDEERARRLRHALGNASVTPGLFVVGLGDEAVRILAEGEGSP